MRILFRSAKNKKGLSDVIAYVLLIAITISLSVMVYSWLRFYPGFFGEGEQCPEGISVIVKDYECMGGLDGSVNVTLKNKGRFNVSGYVLRVNDRPDAQLGFYVLDNSGTKIAPGSEYSKIYYFNDSSYNFDHDLEGISLIEVQPFRADKDGDKLCDSLSFQEAVCS